MIYTNLTKKAMKIAFEAHKNQVDKNGMPYIYHPIHLAEQMDDEETVCVALLHDVVEDTDISLEDLKQEGFSEEILKALKLMTHDDFVPYMDYVKKIKTNPIATKVKLADLKHNSDLTRLDIVDQKAIKRAEKYKEAIEMLIQSEPEEKTITTQTYTNSINGTQYEVGQKIPLGNYWCNYSEFKERIDWRILDISGNIATLISEHCLITTGFCDAPELCDWKTSAVRKICNTEFYNSAFTEEEKKIICPKTYLSPTPDNICNDKVFILTEDEVLKYFKTTNNRTAIPTEYAKKNGALLGWNGFEKYSSWWVMPYYECRTGVFYPQAVFHNGEIQYHSRNVYHTDFTVRPCIQIDLNMYNNEIGFPKATFELCGFSDDPVIRAKEIETLLKKSKKRLEAYRKQKEITDKTWSKLNEYEAALKKANLKPKLYNDEDTKYYIVEDGNIFKYNEKYNLFYRLDLEKFQWIYTPSYIGLYFDGHLKFEEIPNFKDYYIHEETTPKF